MHKAAPKMKASKCYLQNTQPAKTTHKHLKNHSKLAKTYKKHPISGMTTQTSQNHPKTAKKKRKEKNLQIPTATHNYSKPIKTIHNHSNQPKSSTHCKNQPKLYHNHPKLCTKVYHSSRLL